MADDECRKGQVDPFGPATLGRVIDWTCMADRLSIFDDGNSFGRLFFLRYSELSAAGDFLRLMSTARRCGPRSSQQRPIVLDSLVGIRQNKESLGRFVEHLVYSLSHVLGQRNLNLSVRVMEQLYGLMISPYDLFARSRPLQSQRLVMSLGAGYAFKQIVDFQIVRADELSGVSLFVKRTGRGAPRIKRFAHIHPQSR
jgi:hypothetical protein